MEIRAVFVGHEGRLAVDVLDNKRAMRPVKYRVIWLGLAMPCNLLVFTLLIGINVSPAVGPALAGVLVARFGLAAPLWPNAVSNFGVIGALLWRKLRQTGNRNLPAERFGNAIRTGFRYARNTGKQQTFAARQQMVAMAKRRRG